MLTATGNEGKLGLFAGIEEMKFRRKVVPGDQLITEVEMLRASGRAGKVRVTCRVDGEVAAEGQYTFMLVPDPVQQEQPVGKE
jgi:3-hydroxyacyl-[acyl-carrier-protein] dehydratase